MINYVHLRWRSRSALVFHLQRLPNLNLSKYTKLLGLEVERVFGT